MSDARFYITITLAVACFLVALIGGAEAAYVLGRAGALVKTLPTGSDS